MFDPVSERRLQLWLGSATLGLLFVLVVGLTALGNRTFAAGFSIHADFADLSNLNAGSKVQVAGVVVGRVLAVVPVARTPAPTTTTSGVDDSGRATAPGSRVRAVLWIERRHANRVRRTSRALVTSVGVVGRRYVEILPADGEPGPPCRGGEVIRGVDAPKIDRLIDRTFVQIKAFATLAREVEPELARLGAARRGLEQTLDSVGGPQRVTALLARLDRLGAQAQTLWGDVASQTGGGRMDRAAASIKRLVDRTDQVGALLDRGQEQLSRAEELAGLWSPAQRRRLSRAEGQLDRSLTQTRATLATLARLWRKVLAGDGTVGRLLTDPELVDEIRQIHRILKEQPQRAMGKGK